MAAHRTLSARSWLSTTRAGHANHRPLCVDRAISGVPRVEVRRVVRRIARRAHMIHLRVARSTVGADDLVAAVNALHQGGVVAFPTETFYGLAADPRSASAVKRIFELKGRAADQPLPSLASVVDQIEQH